MRVLVACEFSGIVRDAFTERGHYAMSCDLLATERPGPHYQGDVRDVIGQGWDLMLAFPPCTYLANSGARWHAGTDRQRQAAEFVKGLFSAPIPRVAIENPHGALSTLWRKPDLVIHPWEFGHRETKRTCLWLRGLPPLMPSEVWGPPYEAKVWRMGESASRWKDRSRTYPGIAAAMAEQWGALEEVSVMH